MPEAGGAWNTAEAPTHNTSGLNGRSLLKVGHGVQRTEWKTTDKPADELEARLSPP